MPAKPVVADALAHGLFRRLARFTAGAVGTPFAFVGALTLCIGWALSGPLFGYSETWQLVINTGTTIITFLMVFLIQHTQNRDSKELHLKLDELLRAVAAARTGFVGLDQLDDAEIERLGRTFRRLAVSCEDGVVANTGASDRAAPGDARPG